MTSAGPLDILGEVGVQRDHAALLSWSRRVELGEGLVVRVLDMDALIETTREAGREKNLAMLPILSRTLAESTRGERRGAPSVVEAAGIAVARSRSVAERPL